MYVIEKKNDFYLKSVNFKYFLIYSLKNKRKY